MSGNERVFLGLGSNQGDPRANLQRAIDALAELQETKIVAQSTFIKTEPWGVPDQPKFLNAVIEIRTALEPGDLLTAVKKLEVSLGRISTYRWGPRVIDIDILVYGTRIVSLPDLIIPHKLCTQRDFVMEPLREIAPEVAAGLVDGSWVNSSDDPKH